MISSAEDIEKIKKSHIFNTAIGVTSTIDQIDVDKIYNINEIINSLEQYIKTKYPQYWSDYNEGKLYSSNNIENIVNNIFKFITRIIKQNIESINTVDNNTKQILLSTINNQLQSIIKLNSVYSNFKLDITPLIIYQLGYLLRLI